MLSPHPHPHLLLGIPGTRTLRVQSVRPSATASCEHGFPRTYLSPRPLGPQASMAGVLTWACKDPDTGETQVTGDLGPDDELQQGNPPMATV